MNSSVRASTAPTAQQRQAALVSALTEILWRIGEPRKECVVLTPSPDHPRDRFSPTLLFVNRFSSAQALEEFLWNHLEQVIASALPGADFIQFLVENGFGVLMFLYSAILTRGIQTIRSDMDDANGKLIGMHGYCTQDLVHLLLCGYAASNTFDGVKKLDDITLKGITSRSQIGFLTTMEKYGACSVGANIVLLTRCIGWR